MKKQSNPEGDVVGWALLSILIGVALVVLGALAVKMMLDVVIVIISIVAIMLLAISSQK